MARRQVPVRPLQRALGNDFEEDEDIGKLAYLAEKKAAPQIDVSGTAQPMQAQLQDYEDVPRQMEQSEPSWWQRFVDYAENRQPPPVQEEYSPEDLAGLEMAGQIQMDDETQPPVDVSMEEDVELEPLAQLGDQQEPELVQENVQMSEEVQEEPPAFSIVQAIQERPEVLNLLPPEARKLFEEGDEIKIGERLQEVEEMLRPYAGAVEAAMNNDAIMETLMTFDGLKKPYDDETLADAVALSNITTKKKELLNQRERELLASMESGTLTDKEIVALGIATVVPALLALFFGKEAALGAIAGGLKGASEYITQRQPNTAKIREGLMEVEEERKKTLADEVDLKKKISEQVKSPKLRRFVENRSVEAFSNDGKLGLEVDPDYGLYLDLHKMKSDRDFDKWDKDEKKDREAVAVQAEVNDSLEQMKDLMEELKKQNPSFYSVFWDNMRGYVPKTFRDVVPESLKLVKTEPIKVMVNGEVREVDPVRQLEQLMNKFQTAYIDMNDMDNRLTNNVKDHLSKVLPNPGSLLEWFSQDIDDFIEKVNTLKNESNRKFVTKAELNGYVGSPLKAKFPYGKYEVVNQDSIQRGFRSALAEPEKNESLVVR